MAGKRVIEDMRRQLTPERIREQIAFYNEKTKDFSAIREDFLQRATPTEQALKEQEAMRQEFLDGQKEVMAKPRDERYKAMQALVKKLESKYGRDAYIAMATNQLPPSADPRKALANAIGADQSARNKVRIEAPLELVKKILLRRRRLSTG